jgi:hypothetical protein
MAFEGGHKKHGGRKKGTPNKITKEIRAVLKNYVAEELTNLPSIVDSLEQEKRLEILLKLLPYVLPKVNSVNPSHDEPISFP